MEDQAQNDKNESAAEGSFLPSEGEPMRFSHNDASASVTDVTGTPAGEPMRFADNDPSAGTGMTGTQAGQPMRFSGGNPNPYSRYISDTSVPGTVNAKPAKNSVWLTRAWLWVMAAAVMFMCALILLKVTGKSPEVEPVTAESSGSRIPYNGYEETSYAGDNSLAEAPEVSANPNGPQISLKETSTAEGGSVVNAAFKKASPSVVCITAYPSGGDYTLNKSGEGSGIIVSEDGYLVTNSHVINNNRGTGVVVTLHDGKQFLGTIIGLDAKTDLAVIKISSEGLTPAEFADSSSLFVGQEVYAIGNPGGSAFSNSLTKGTVSAVNRILVSNGYVKYIQTDAAINPGNSGGALINDNGQVVGVNTSKLVATDYEGMSFAIPSNTVVQIVNKLIKYGFINDRGTLDIEVTTCDLYQSRKNNVPQGVVITKINVNSPLIKTQVKEKDIIIGINDVTVVSSNEFIDELSKYKPGDSVKLKLFRAADGSKKSTSFEVSITLIKDGS